MRLDEIMSAVEKDSKKLKNYLEKQKGTCFAIAETNGSVSFSEDLENMTPFANLNGEEKEKSCIILANMNVIFSKYLEVKNIEFYFEIAPKTFYSLLGSTFVNTPFKGISENNLINHLIRTPPRFLKLFPLKLEGVDQKRLKFTLALNDFTLVVSPPKNYG